MDLNKKNIKKICVIVAFGVILYWILQNISIIGQVLSTISSIIFPFLLGAGIAFVINIPMSIIEKKWFKDRKNKKQKTVKIKWKRPISIILSIVILFVIIRLLIGYIVPELINVINIFIDQLPDLMKYLQDFVTNIMNSYSNIGERIMGMDINFDDITNEAVNLLKNLGTTLVSSSIGIVISVINGIITFFVAMIFSVYILLNKEKLIVQVKKLIYANFSEKTANRILEIANLSNNTFNKFITGQCTEALILGLLCTVGMIIFKIPYAATIGCLVAITALVPIVGAFIGGGIGFLMILALSPVKALIFIVFLIILQQIEGNIIYPKVVGDSVGLPGMWVLVAITIGGSLWGIFGMLIGLPIISVIYTIIRNNTNRKLEEKKIKID